MELAGCWYEKSPSLIFFFPFQIFSKGISPYHGHTHTKKTPRCLLVGLNNSLKLTISYNTNDSIS